MTTYANVDELTAAIGSDPIVGEWATVTQERINEFADATGDRQWIHLDAERAASGPFGTTIAHGYLTLSMTVALLDYPITVEGQKLVINYGLDKVRFLSPVPVDSRIRATSQLASVTPAAQGVRVGSTVTVEIEGVEKPALIAETISLYVLN